MASGEPDWTGRWTGKIDHWYIKGVTLLTPTISASVPISIENPAIAYDAVNDRFKVDIQAIGYGTQDVDVIDRAARLLGIVYGSQSQQLLQRASTYDLLVQLRHAGAEIDPRDIRTITEALDISDRAARDLGKVDIAAFDVELPAGTQKIGSVDISTLPQKGIPNRFYGTASAELVAAGGAGYKHKVYGLLIVNESDEITRLRYGGASGTVFAVLPSKGVMAMNLVQIDEYGGDNENIYVEKTGSGNALVVVWSETVAV